MQKFDVYEINDDLYAVVQAQHLLDINSVILVPLLPQGDLPSLSKLTVDVRLKGSLYTIRAHMPLTVEARRLRRLTPVAQLSPEEGQNVMDALYAILWGF